MKDMHVRLKNYDLQQNIHSSEDFHKVLKRERFRADRNNHEFSLIVFDVGVLKKNMGAARHFIDILTSRVRVSDEVGLYDERRLAVLLPDTSSRGAKVLADNVCREVPASASCLEYECFTYTYPSQKLFAENSFSRSNRFEEDVNIKIATGHKTPFWKRAIDIIFASIFLLALSPLLGLVAIMIKMVSSGPVFFRQKRVGRSGKIFTMYKFRTMKVNNNAAVHHEYLKELINGDSKREKPMVKLKNDSRIIPMGNIVRKASIDELPQMINVLLGEMSLVGPRPCIPYEAEEYLRWHARRFDIIPGLTGLWQVNGKNKTTFKEMIRLDIEYAVRRSFWLDIKILLKTPMVVLSQAFENFPALKNNSQSENKKVKVRVAEVA